MQKAINPTDFYLFLEKVDIEQISINAYDDLINCFTYEIIDENSIDFYINYVVSAKVIYKNLSICPFDLYIKDEYVTNLMFFIIQYVLDKEKRSLKYILQDGKEKK